MPTLADVARGRPRRRVPRRRAEGRRSRGGRPPPSCGPAAATRRRRRSCPRSTGVARRDGRAAARLAALAQRGGPGAGRCRWRSASGAARSRSDGRRSPPKRGAGRDAGIEVAAWTVTRPRDRRPAGRARRGRLLCRGAALEATGPRQSGRLGPVLEAGDVRATVHPEDGGRIGSLVVDGHEVILGGDHGPDALGQLPDGALGRPHPPREVLVPGPRPPAAAGDAAARDPRRGLGPAMAGR